MANPVAPHQNLLIRGAAIVGPQGTEAGDVLIENGVIAAIGARLEAPDGARVLDARGLCAAPGLIDMHVHLRDPGQTQKEDIVTGLAAAAAGGFTAVAAMPNTSPAADSPETLAYELARAAGRGVRLLPIAAVSRGQKGEELVDFAALAAAGAAAFSDDGRPVKDAGQMLAAMRAAQETGRVVISHCEDMSLAARGIVSDTAAARLGADMPGIPAAAEAAHAARECVLAETTGTRVHIAHVSSRFTVALIRDAKRRGAPVTCETCPHYFSLTDDVLQTRDADYRMNPPLRRPGDVKAVIDGLRDGTIDAVVTDHAPHTPAEKADFLRAPNGVVGLETSLAAGITFLVRAGHLSLWRLLEKMSAAPARILGLPGGRLCPGAPGDVLLFDPAREWTVQPEHFRTKGRSSAFKGMRLFGAPVCTVAAGQIIFSDGTVSERVG